MKKSTKKQNFSRFTPKEAFKLLKTNNLIRWKINFQPLEPTDFFKFACNDWRILI